MRTAPTNQLKFDLIENSLANCQPNLSEAIQKLATQGGADARGAIFTKPEVVEFILDLVGYTVDQPLHRMRVLEPSFGGGDFLVPVIRRLLAAWRAAKSNASIIEDLGDKICAIELHQDTFCSTRELVIASLIKEGISEADSRQLADGWLLQGDYLLAALEKRFEFVVGNPPYVRQEMIPAALLAEYRNRYSTLFDRADLYIPFFERSLGLLAKGGVLGFICADRWTKNRYGGPLRKLISSQFHLRAYVDVSGASAFQNEVSAYPAIAIIGREAPGPTRFAHCEAITHSALEELSKELRVGKLPVHGSNVREFALVPNGTEPWVLDSSDQLALIRRLERQLPSLEEAGCKVGIGVATGADKEFIGNFAALEVEEDRKLPLVTTRDITDGEINWTGLGVINPFQESGALVDLSRYPLLRRYLEARKEAIAGRHCAKKAPGNWYRTIDRITPSLASKPKLLIPDIKGNAHIVFEPGQLYPHHNLYYITSEEWDLRALQAVLLSGIARLFVANYPENRF
jgi:hypothetical protein